MKRLLLVLILVLPCFGMGKKPPEPKCDRTIRLTKEWEGKVQCFGLTSEESRVLKELAQEKIQQENVWYGDTTQMSKPKKPQPQAPKADTGEHKRILAGTIDIKPGESLLNLHGATIIYSPELDSLESLWTVFIKGQITTDTLSYLLLVKGSDSTLCAGSVAGAIVSQFRGRMKVLEPDNFDDKWYLLVGLMLFTLGCFIGRFIRRKYGR